LGERLARDRRGSDMDVICRKCGEPWDVDSFHDVAEDNGTTWDDASREFRRSGCAVFGITCSEDRSDATAAAEAIYDLLGDDMDGAAALLEDMGFA